MADSTRNGGLILILLCLLETVTGYNVVSLECSDFTNGVCFKFEDVVTRVHIT